MNESVRCYGDKQHLVNTASSTGAREGSVLGEIRDLHNELQSLDEMTGKLTAILGIVMVDRPRPAFGCEKDGPAVNAVHRSEVAGQIHAATGLAVNIKSKVSDILCCLDL